MVDRNKDNVMRKIFLILIVFVTCGLAKADTLFINSPFQLGSGGGGSSPVITVDLEEGNLTDFDSTTDPDSDLAAAAGAAMNSTNYGLSVTIDDTAACYGQVTLSGEDFTAYGKFKLSLYFDPNSVTMSVSTSHQVGKTEFSGSPYNFLRILLDRTTTPSYAFSLIPYDDSGALTVHQEEVSDGPHLIEIEVTRASSDVAGDGSIVFKIDSSTVNTWSDVDIYDVFSTISVDSWGAITGIDATTSGDYYIDEINYYDNF